MKTGRRSAPGFTLIELMIVLAIVAVLAAISYPSYMDFVRNGWHSEARSALMQQMQQQERYFTLEGRYRRQEGDSGEGGSGKYVIESGNCEGQGDIGRCLRLRARLKPEFLDPQVRSFWIDSMGNKGCDGTPREGCWP